MIIPLEREVAAQRARTHMHVIGSTGTGKSKFLEHLMRHDLGRAPFCMIDWHGTLYNDLLEYMAFTGYPGRVILLNPSDPQYVTGFNPFLKAAGDVSTAVARRMDATLKPWGMENTNQTPTLENVCRTFYQFTVLTGEPLPNAAMLLFLNRKDLRRYAADISQGRFKARWEELNMISTPREWRERVLSTDNRLSRFVESDAIRRFMGRKSGNIDLRQILDSRTILLVNLAPSDYLSRDAAKIFAALLLNEFFETAMRLHSRKHTYTLYLDEFQEYITLDMARMLDQVRKGGLHLVLAHQHLGHLAQDEAVRKSIFGNCRMRAVFGGLEVSDAKLLAEELCLDRVNERWIKEEIHHTVTKHRETLRASVGITKGRGTGRSEQEMWSEASGVSDGNSSLTGMGMGAGTGLSLRPDDETISTDSRFSSDFASEGSFYGTSLTSAHGRGQGTHESLNEGVTVSVSPFLEPYYELEKSGVIEWSREEKVSHLAAELKFQPDRTCRMKLDGLPAFTFQVPNVRRFLPHPDCAWRYQVQIHERAAALPAREIERELAESAEDFERRVRAHLEGKPKAFTRRRN